MRDHNIQLRELLDARPQPSVVTVPVPDEMLAARMRELGRVADYELDLIARVADPSNRDYLRVLYVARALLWSPSS